MRVVQLLNLVDGSLRHFKDDGVDGSGKPRVKRLALLAAIKKRFKRGGGPIFRAGAVVTGADGRTSFVPVEIPSAFPGDELPSLVAPLDDAALKIVEANMVERTKREAVAQDQRQDLARFLESNAKALAATNALLANVGGVPKAKKDAQ